MPTIRERTRELRSIYRTQNNLDLIPATIVTKNGQIQDPLIPGNYWASYQTSNGLSTTRSVGGPAKVLPLKSGTCVLLETFRGKLRIRELDPDRERAKGGDPQSALQFEKRSGTPQGDLETLRLVPKSGLTVSLKGWNAQISGVYYESMFADIDLTSYVPSAGQMCYALIGTLEDLSGVEVKTSTARGVRDTSLDADDVNEAIALLTAGSTGQWAVKLIGGQTTVTQTDIDTSAKDLRGVVNAFDGEYAASVSTTDATVTTLYTLTVPASTTVAVHGYIFARRTGGSSGTAEDGAYYERAAAIKNVGGTATLIGSVASVATMEDQAGWDATFDVTGATVRCRITGAANNNVNWKGKFKVMKVS